MAKLTRLVDNAGSPIFSVFMAVWAVVFLEKWKRFQSEICARWDVSDQEMNATGEARPEFAFRVTTTRVNHITKKHEPYMRRRTTAQRLLMSVASA